MSVSPSGYVVARRENGSRRVFSIDESPSRTRQEFKDECDINFILRNYQRTGALNHFAKFGPQYGDFSSIDFHESMNVVASANTMFAELPSKVRRRFGNDPGAFLEFVQDPGNSEEMRKLGLMESPEPAGQVPPGGPDGQASDSAPGASDSAAATA